MINNLIIIFLPSMNLYSQTSQNIYRQFTKAKLKLQENVASSGFNHKER